MTEDKKPETAAKTDLKVVGEEPDPFTELLTAVAETQDQARLALEKAGKLARLVKDAQRAVKAKEKEHVRTQKLISDLKKVSGF